MYAPTSYQDLAYLDNQYQCGWQLRASIFLCVYMFLRPIGFWEGITVGCLYFFSNIVGIIRTKMQMTLKQQICSKRSHSHITFCLIQIKGGNMMQLVLRSVFLNSTLFNNFDWWLNCLRWFCVSVVTRRLGKTRRPLAPREVLGVPVWQISRFLFVEIAKSILTNYIYILENV